MNKNTLFWLLAGGAAWWVYNAAEKKKHEKQLMLGNGNEIPTGQLMDAIIADASAPASSAALPVSDASSAVGSAVLTAFDEQVVEPNGDYESLWMDNIQDPWA